MKVEDLMIGDWYYWEAEGKKYPMQVTKDTFKLSDEDIANFQPIPLTQEILEKNFTIYDLEYFIPEYPNHNPEENDYFSIYYNKWNGLSTIWKVEYIDGFYSDIETRCASIVSIKYVHDLQQFLRLLKITYIDLKL
jgi:hypothetical protein